MFLLLHWEMEARKKKDFVLSINNHSLKKKYDQISYDLTFKDVLYGMR